VKKICVNKIVIAILAIILSMTLIPISSACTLLLKPTFENIVISSSIEKDTLKPLDEKTEFEASAENIYATVKYSNVKGEDNYRFKWTNLDTGETVLDVENQYAKDKEGKYISGTIMSRIDPQLFKLKIISPGDYKVDYYHKGEVIKTTTFKVTKPQAKIMEASLTNQIDDKGAPVNKTQKFSSNETVYACVKFDNQTIGTNVEAKWKSSTGELIFDSGNYTMPKDYFSPSYITFSFPEKSGTPITAGNYKVEIYLNDNLYGSFDFEVTGETNIARGSRIVFTSNRDGNYEVYIMNSDGTNLVNLTNNAANDYKPIWAPDDEIIFESNRDGNAEIYAMKLDGTDLTNITNNEASDISPALSPDTNMLAFASDRTGNYDIYVMDKNGNVVNLTNDGYDDDRPTWTPDGKKIIFESNRSGDYELYVMNSDGSEIINLTNNKAWDEQPKVSPDNSKIVFASDRDGNVELYLLNQEGNITRLTDNEAYDWLPAWSPDGSKIAFTSDRDGNYEIYIMNSDGSGPTRITNNDVDDWDPSWY
jgi:dipeptidyl aminopeptidase/acylaminoacyl peptidase/uncharacterized protein (DUF2249 family)